MDSLWTAYLTCRSVENRNAIVEANINLVNPVAALLASGHIPFDDLLQAGRIGLIKAVEGFKPENPKLAKFPTYARHKIFGYVRDFVRENTEFRKRARRNIDIPEQLNRDVQCPDDDDVVVDSAQDVVAEMCKSLSMRLRRIFVLRYGHDLPFKEVGRRLGLSPSRISQLHKEGIEKLRRTGISL